MKILLINPVIRNKVWAGIPEMCSKNVFLFPPLGLMYLQSSLKARTAHRVELLDALAEDLDYGSLAERVRAFAPDVVGVTAVTHNLAEVFKAVQAVKGVDASIHVCIGGPHVHAYPEAAAALDGVDSAVPGDGEITFAELCDALENGRPLSTVNGILFKGADGAVERTAAAEQLHALDELPLPDRSGIDLKRYYTPATETGAVTTMITGRGCPQRCTFCNTYAAYRSRSARNIVDEIEDCVGRGIEEIFFIDDTFNVTVKRVTEIADEILRRGIRVKWGFKARVDQVTDEMLALIKKAGCTKVHYGVETGTDEGLTALNKRITIAQIERTFALTRKHGIRTIGFFMLGCPHEHGKEEVLSTIAFSRRLAADYAVFAIFSPYPDTEAYRQGVEQGLFDPAQWEGFLKDPLGEYDLPTVWNEHFTKDELVRLLKVAHRRFYLRPSIIAKNLFCFHSFAELKRTFMGGLALLRLEFLRSDGRKI